MRSYDKHGARRLGKQRLVLKGHRYGEHLERGVLDNRRRERLGYVRTARGSRMPLWYRYDPVLLLILAVFVAYELVAHFHYHNANGFQTLSNRIIEFQRHFGWPARIVVYAGLIALGVHLWGGTF